MLSGNQFVLQKRVRGYTGHEHLNYFGFINMNGRMYGYSSGRMFSPDNYVQAPDFTQSYNRYSYCWNNPLKYTDPSGEFFLPLLLLFTDTGYELQKSISPVAVKVDVHIGSDQTGIGANVSVGVPKMLPISYRAEVGATYYSNYYGQSGWETRYGGEYTLNFYGTPLPRINISGTHYSFNGYEQTVNQITIGGPLVNLKYENDFMFNLSIPGIPTADNGDRYRSAAGELNVGPLSLGFKFFTGDPGLDINDRKVNYDKGGLYGQYEANNEKGYNPDKYRAGIGYVGIGGFRFGKNSEQFRNSIQNQLIHDKVSHSPHFRVIPSIPDRWYWGWGSTGNGLW